MEPDPSLFPGFPREDYLAHKAAIDEALRRMLDRGHYILGGEVDAFEKEFADWTGTRHAVGVANGTDSIEIILRALGIGRGGKVAVPSHTAVASVSAIARAGAEPVFVDVDADTFTMCPGSLARLFASPEGRDVRAVLAVHLYGHPVAWAEIQDLCSRHKVELLEDCAQAHGAVYHSRKAGSLGRAASFSFYPTKNLAAVGDAGAITTDDDDLAERLRIIRQYGWRRRYISDCEGVNSRLDELQAAVLRVKLRTLDQRLAARRSLAARYRARLESLPFVSPPVIREGCGHAFHLYVVQCPQRDALMRHLEARGIPVALHYPAAVHQQPAYHHAKATPMPRTEAMLPTILTLPLHPYLSEAAIDAVADAIESFPA